MQMRTGERTMNTCLRAPTLVHQDRVKSSRYLLPSRISPARARMRGVVDFVHDPNLLRVSQDELHLVEYGNGVEGKCCCGSRLAFNLCAGQR